jgi:hypothetical protein
MQFCICGIWGCVSSTFKAKMTSQPTIFWKYYRVILCKWSLILYFKKHFDFAIIHNVIGTNFLCKWKASKSPTIHTWHLSDKNEFEVAVTGSNFNGRICNRKRLEQLNIAQRKPWKKDPATRNIFQFHISVSLSSCLAKERCIPVIDNFKLLHSGLPTQICGQTTVIWMVILTTAYNITVLFYISTLNFLATLSKRSCALMKINWQF